MQPPVPQAPAPAAPPAAPVNPATITGQSSQAPVAAPAVAAPSYDVSGITNAIRDYYQIPQNTFAAQNEAQGLYARNYQTDQNSREAAKQQAAQKVDNINPSKYTFKYDPTGKSPTQVFDPQGNPVSVSQFAQQTGANPAQYLQNSDNVDEQQFVQAYSNYAGFMKALLNNDKSSLDKYFANNQGLQGMTPEQVRQLFMAQYGNFVGVHQSNVPYGVNRGFAPGNTTNSNDQLLQQLFGSQ